jgi:hypothetical protein
VTGAGQDCPCCFAGRRFTSVVAEAVRLACWAGGLPPLTAADLLTQMAEDIRRDVDESTPGQSVLSFEEKAGRRHDVATIAAEGTP